MSTIRLFPMEVRRLLQSRLTWLIAGLVILAPALGLGLYALARRAFRSDGRALRWCNAVGLACTVLVLALTALLVAANA